MRITDRTIRIAAILWVLGAGFLIFQLSRPGGFRIEDHVAVEDEVLVEDNTPGEALVIKPDMTAPQVKQMIIKNFKYRNNLRNLEDTAWAFNSLPIRNTDRFRSSNYTVAILILVHSRELYLIEAVKLLKQVHRIEEALIIVSYDGIFSSVSNVIDSIDFCAVKEMAYPWSYHYVSEITKRTNDETPLRLLAYKNTKGYLKHHMAWAFTQTMEVIRNSGPNNVPLFDKMIHLEDDVFVTKDLIQSLLALHYARDHYCQECFGVVMGYHNPRPFTKKDKFSPVSSDFRCQTVRSMAGWSLSVPVWKKFHNERENFCAGYTSHWDDSVYLLHRPGCCPWKMGNFDENARRPIRPLYLYSSYPRAMHMGSCQGLHYRAEKKGGNCTSAWAVDTFRERVGVDVIKDHDYDPAYFQYVVNVKDIPEKLGKCEAQHTANATYGSKIKSMIGNKVTYSFCRSIMTADFKHVPEQQWPPIKWPNE